MTYWKFNLSPYVFHIDQIPLDWMKTFWGGVILTIVPLIIQIYLYVGQKRFVGGNPLFLMKTPYQIKNFKTVFYYGCGILAAFFIMKENNFDWGLRWYTTMYFLSYFEAYLLLSYWIKKKDLLLTQELLDNLMGKILLGMIVGARLAYVFIYNWDSFSKNWMDIFKVWEGGLSFHGGIVGIMVAIYFFCKKHSVPFFHLLDKIALTVPFGVGIGRIGNFMNGELYGRIIESPVPWAIIFPSGGPLPRHPSQLYQSLLDGWLTMIILFWIARTPRKEGTITLVGLLLYCIFRIITEFFREPDEQLQYYFNHTTTMGQILCGVFMIFVLAGFYLIKDNIVEKSPAWMKRRETLS